jgi:hypothetical protein
MISLRTTSLLASSLVLAFLAARITQAPSADAAAPPFPDDAFWKEWGDGRAEVSGYDLTFPRYGEPRRGTAVTIFVTETFSREARVKADPGKHAKSDEFPVMKLNLVEDFPTGVYDYNLMTSVFVALAPTKEAAVGTPTKISFSSQEWCGHVYMQSLFDGKSIRRTSHSYFDGEADEEETIERKVDGFAEESILLWARGFAAPFLSPGQSRVVPFLPSAQTARLSHRPSTWTTATLSRSKDARSVALAAGTFECETFTVDTGGERSWTIDLEKAPPHRIIRWETSAGGRAELLSGERMKYWEMNGGEFLNEVKRLGLSPRPVRTM